MTDVKVIVGANLGDEGKGLMTDFFCNQAKQANKSCIVCLSNGGAQRGHTVDTVEGGHHVFKHFGSGSFVKADTYCIEDFILNPMEFCREYEELLSLGLFPAVFVHPNCRWSTPFDMIINQIVEGVRDGKRHGSCGMGIWETIVRYERKPNIFSFENFTLLSHDSKVSFLKNIRDNYMPERLKDYGINCIPDNWKAVVYNDNLIEHFINDVMFMKLHICCRNYSLLQMYDTVVFENGQGLLLDQNAILYGDNTTPSNTGVINSLNVMNKTFNQANLEVCYVTRTYMTRHGAGRFETECAKDMINPHMMDKTNQTNEFQGHLRYGELSTDRLLQRVHTDLRHLNKSKFNWSATIGVTHTNEKQLDYSLLQRGLISDIYMSDNKYRDSVKIFKEEG